MAFSSLAALQRLHNRGEDLGEEVQVFGKPLKQLFPFCAVREIAITSDVDFAALRLLGIVPRQRQINPALQFSPAWFPEWKNSVWRLLNSG